MNPSHQIWGTWPAKELTTPERELLRAALENRGDINRHDAKSVAASRAQTFP